MLAMIAGSMWTFFSYCLTWAMILWNSSPMVKKWRVMPNGFGESWFQVLVAAGWCEEVSLVTEPSSSTLKRKTYLKRILQSIFPLTFVCVCVRNILRLYLKVLCVHSGQVYFLSHLSTFVTCTGYFYCWS